jgi:serine-type D-Ala-D-Ala carboxypeptidase/endopeptidase
MRQPGRKLCKNDVADLRRRSRSVGLGSRHRSMRQRDSMGSFVSFGAAAIAATLILAAGMSSSLRAQDAPPPAAAAATWTIPTNEDIRKLLVERMHDNGVGTVVGVIEPAGTRVVVFGRSGAADGRPLDGDTVFQIGSLSKVFVGLLLADMVQRGEVALDDPAQKYLPSGVKMPQRGRPITLLDLSTHRSGLPSMPNNFRLEADPNPIEAYTVDDLWQFLARFQLTREPGEKFEYSNLGVSLLGRLLALRAGKDYETLLKERVLDPLGLRSTAITVTPAMNARLAPGHDRYLQPLYVWEMKTLQASGSLRSTANDLLRFVGAYLDNPRTRLADAMALQLCKHFPEKGTAAALGWGVVKTGEREIYTHEGGKTGYRSAASFDPRARTGIVVLQNARTDDRPTALALHLLTGRALPPAPKAPPPKAVVRLAPEVLQRYAGNYRAKEGTVRVLHKRDHLLVSYEDGDGGLEFFATGEREFFYSAGNDDLTFEVGGNGVVTGMRIYSDGKAAGVYDLAPRIDVGQTD